MSAGSLIGFALAFIAATWIISLVFGAGMLVLSRATRRDPALERAATGVALVMPPLLGAAAVAAVIVYSIRAAGGAGDHCGPHDHHPHLCVIHGAAWAANAWAVAALAVAGAVVLARGVRLMVAHVRGGRAIDDLGRIAVEMDGVLHVPSERPFLFVAGARGGAIFVSSAAWQALAPAERAAAVAHERAH